MILSHSAKFIFIKGRKVAGTSAEVLLSQHCDDEDIITPITAIDEQKRLIAPYRRGAQNYSDDRKAEVQHLELIRTSSVDALQSIRPLKQVYYNHMPLKEVIEKSAIDPDDYFIFGIERCPYRKIVSYANMMLTFSNYKAGKPQLPSNARTRKYIGKIFSTGHFTQVRNIDLYRIDAPQPKVKIFKFEDLSGDLKEIFGEMGRSNSQPLPHLKKGSATAFDPNEFFFSRAIPTDQ